MKHSYRRSSYMDLVDNLTRLEIEVKSGIEKPPVVEPEGIRDNPTP